jgi:hypothetical protein
MSGDLIGRLIPAKLALLSPPEMDEHRRAARLK